MNHRSDTLRIHVDCRRAKKLMSSWHPSSHNLRYEAIMQCLMNCRGRESQDSGKEDFPPIRLPKMKKIDEIHVVESLGNRHSKKQLMGVKVSVTLKNFISQNVQSIYPLLHKITLVISQFFKF